MVLAGWGTLDRRWQAVATLSMAAGVVPIILSVNRGLWIGIVAGVVYGSLLLAKRGDRRYMKVLAIAAIVVIGLTFVPQINNVVVGRLESDHTNNARLTLYSQVLEQVDESPWFGYGAPIANEENPNLPAVGTHGQFWTVLFSHGIPGVLLYIAFALSLARRTLRDRDVTSTWLHVATALVPLLMWFYELLTPPTFIVMLAGATPLRTEIGARPARSHQPDAIHQASIVPDSPLTLAKVLEEARR